MCRANGELFPRFYSSIGKRCSLEWKAETFLSFCKISFNVNRRQRAQMSVLMRPKVFQRHQQNHFLITGCCFLTLFSFLLWLACRCWMSQVLIRTDFFCSGINYGLSVSPAFSLAQSILSYLKRFVSLESSGRSVKNSLRQWFCGLGLNNTELVLIYGTTLL